MSRQPEEGSPSRYTHAEINETPNRKKEKEAEILLELLEAKGRFHIFFN